jgi:hypothetical protein
MSSGRIFDRPGHPPVKGPPPPGTVLEPLGVTKIAQLATALVVAAGFTVVLPDAAALFVGPLALLLAYRAYNAGTVRVEASGLVLMGFFRTLRLKREQVDDVDFWLLRWHTAKGRKRRWQLWPYAQFGVMWPGVVERSDEVMESLRWLVESWHSRPDEAPPRSG